MVSFQIYNLEFLGFKTQHRHHFLCADLLRANLSQVGHLQLESLVNIGIFLQIRGGQKLYVCSLHKLSCVVYKQVLDQILPPKGHLLAKQACNNITSSYLSLQKSSLSNTEDWHEATVLKACLKGSPLPRQMGQI